MLEKLQNCVGMYTKPYVNKKKNTHIVSFYPTLTV